MIGKLLEKLDEISPLVVASTVLFGLWAMNFASPPLQTLGIVIFLTALLFPLLAVMLIPILRPIRNTIEPLAILYEHWPWIGISEPEFKWRVLHWQDASVDSCFYALAILYELGLKEDVEACRPSVVEFLAHSFDHEQGAFRQSARAKPSVYASSMAIKALKPLVCIDPHAKTLGYYDKAREILSAEGIDIQKIINFTKKCQSDSGGFYDFLEDQYTSNQTVSILTTHAACELLWNLDEFEPQPVRDTMVNFVFSCWSEEAGGWSNSPGSEVLSCSTYYALRILERCGKSEWIEEHKDRVADFLRLCWHEKGGFKPSPSSRTRTLVHTSLAGVALLQILKDRAFFRVGRRYKQLLAYIKACEDRHGGFQLWDRGFGLGGRWYAPNLYATYHVVMLERHLKDSLNLDLELDREAIIDFVHSTSSREWQGCVWRGYSRDGSRVGIAIAKIFRKLLGFITPRNGPQSASAKRSPLTYCGMVILSLVCILFGLVFQGKPWVLGLQAGSIAMGAVAVMNLAFWLVLNAQ